MPELPEVETVRRGLAPVMEGARFRRVEARRPDMRFALPKRFAQRLEGKTVDSLDRRGKYMIAALSSGESLIMHLGMSGRFTIEIGGAKQSGGLDPAPGGDPKHDHVVFEMAGRTGARITYNDPRRFGFMDLVSTSAVEECRYFKAMGPEPLGNQFSAASLSTALKGKKTPIKTALLDQRVVAGLGNIYVCEALYRARISPRRRAMSVAGVRSERLHRAILAVLNDAIDAGGSSLKDFANTQGELGYFQHRFDVYDREGQLCRHCGGTIQRQMQAGRSSFFCTGCQR